MSHTQADTQSERLTDGALTIKKVPTKFAYLFAILIFPSVSVSNVNEKYKKIYWIGKIYSLMINKIIEVKIMYSSHR